MEDEVADTVSRRSFLTLMAAMALRTIYVREDQPVSPIPVPPTANANEVTRIKNLCSAPSQWFEPKRTLMWAEMRKPGDAEPKLMLWTPETPEELAEADRFYQAATWRSWRTEPELDELLKTSGNWLVRLNLIGGITLFAAQGDDATTLGASVADVDLTPDVKEAVTVSAARAKEIILGLHQEWKIDEENFMYCEPVSPKEPYRDGRFQFLAIR